MSPLRVLREVAPKCSVQQALQVITLGETNRTRRCATRCYRRAVFCDFKTIYDVATRYDAPFAPFRAGQWLVKRIATPTAAARVVSAESQLLWSEAGSGDTYPVRAARPLRVLLIKRTPLSEASSYSTRNRKGKHSLLTETIENVDELLQRCAAAPLLDCKAYDFGRRGLVEDMRHARQADVLVGTHGSGLNQAFFLRRGSALVEVRPYGFEGSWPDQYFKAMLQVEAHPVHYYQISTGTPLLMNPPPSEPDVRGWDARNGRNVVLPWHTLREVLRGIIAVNGSARRYNRLPSKISLSWPDVDTLDDSVF